MLDKRKNREELQEHLRFLRFFVLYFCLKADKEDSHYAKTQRKQE